MDFFIIFFNLIWKIWTFLLMIVPFPKNKQTKQTNKKFYQAHKSSQRLM